MVFHDGTGWRVVMTLRDKSPSRKPTGRFGGGRAHDAHPASPDSGNSPCPSQPRPPSSLGIIRARRQWHEQMRHAPSAFPVPEDSEESSGFGMAWLVRATDVALEDTGMNCPAFVPNDLHS